MATITYFPAASGGGGGTGDAWYDAQVSAMQALCPTLTRFEYEKPGQDPLGVLFAANAVAGGASVANPAPESNLTEGGAMGMGSDTLYARLTTCIYTAPRTKAMAVAFRVKYPTVATSKTSVVGLTILAATAGVLTFGWDQATDATHFYMGVSGTGNLPTTVLADTLWHTVILSVNPATPLITATLDGAVALTSAAVSTLTNAACGVGIFSSASITPGALVSRFIYGYIDPT